ncbi:hypothetical protein ACWGJT_16250 [Streptomyces xantholiticus]
MNHRRARLCVAVLATVLIGASITTAGAATPADDASAAERLGDITGFEANGDEYTVSSGQVKLRISFQDDDLFRVHLAPDGRFTVSLAATAGGLVVQATDSGAGPPSAGAPRPPDGRSQTEGLLPPSGGGSPQPSSDRRWAASARSRT